MALVIYYLTGRYVWLGVVAGVHWAAEYRASSGNGLSLRYTQVGIRSHRLLNRLD